MKYIFFLSAASLLFVSCENVLIGPDAENTPMNNFETLWGEYDRYYPSFIVKNINWDSLHSVYGSMITPGMSESALWDVFRGMLSNLNDAHVYMYNKDHTWFFSSRRTYGIHYGEFSLDLVKQRYLNGVYKTAGEGNFTYGKMTGDSIGYIHIAMFDGNEDWPKDIDDIVMELRNTAALIIDIRDNRGGSFVNSEYIASAFINRPLTYLKEIARNGPGHTDFTEPHYHTIAPRINKLQYTKKIVFLTNLNTASAAETFGLVFKYLPNAVQIGDSTAGGLGASNRSFQLPNGWCYHMPESLNMMADGRSLEGIGLIPDVYIRNTKREIHSGYDRILSTAIQYILMGK